MRPKGHRKVHEVPKNAKTAQMHPKYLTGPKLASSDQNTESVQSAEKRPNCPRGAQTQKFHHALFWDTLQMEFKMRYLRQYGEILAHMNINQDNLYPHAHRAGGNVNQSGFVSNFIIFLRRNGRYRFLSA